MGCTILLIIAIVCLLSLLDVFTAKKKPNYELEFKLYPVPSDTHYFITIKTKGGNMAILTILKPGQTGEISIFPLDKFGNKTKYDTNSEIVLEGVDAEQAEVTTEKVSETEIKLKVVQKTDAGRHDFNLKFDGDTGEGEANGFAEVSVPVSIIGDTWGAVGASFSDWVKTDPVKTEE